MNYTGDPQALIAMLLGIVGASVIHVSRGMMKLGIQRLRTLPMGKRGRAWRYYAAAVLINHTNSLWVIAASRFAPAPYYSAVYGFGLVALALFSTEVIGEPFSRSNWIGTGLVVLGTLAVGVDRLINPAMEITATTNGPLLISIAIGLGVLLLVTRLLNGRVPLGPREALFGLLAGGLSSFELVLKAAGQRDGVVGLLPSTVLGWLAFLLSFLFALGAFLVTQWAFLRHCRASRLAVISDTAFVVLPVLVVLLAGGAYSFGILTWLGLPVMALGLSQLRGVVGRITDQPVPEAIREPDHSGSTGGSDLRPEAPGS